MAHLSREGVRRDLNVIIKADVSGSLEVLEKTFADLATDEVGINVIHSGVGGVSQADVMLADASDALIIGFHVIADSAAKYQAMASNVQIKIYHVIYRLIEDMKAALEGLLPKVARDVISGHADVREVFRASKIGTIAGCYVTDGTISRKCRLRLIRDQVVIYDGAMESLKRFKDDAKEVRAGFECGIKIANYENLCAGDVIEAYEVEEVARKLE
jgi:translation initiation factor IF-2